MKRGSHSCPAGQPQQAGKKHKEQLNYRHTQEKILHLQLEMHRSLGLSWGTSQSASSLQCWTDEKVTVIHCLRLLEKIIIHVTSARITEKCTYCFVRWFVSSATTAFLFFLEGNPKNARLISRGSDESWPEERWLQRHKQEERRKNSWNYKELRKNCLWNICEEGAGQQLPNWSPKGDPKQQPVHNEADSFRFPFLN